MEIKEKLSFKEIIAAYKEGLFYLFEHPLITVCFMAVLVLIFIVIFFFPIPIDQTLTPLFSALILLGLLYKCFCTYFMNSIKDGNKPYKKYVNFAIILLVALNVIFLLVTPLIAMFTPEIEPSNYETTDSTSSISNMLFLAVVCLSVSVVNSLMLFELFTKVTCDVLINDARYIKSAIALKISRSNFLAISPLLILLPTSHLILLPFSFFTANLTTCLLLTYIPVVNCLMLAKIFNIKPKKKKAKEAKETAIKSATVQHF